MSQEDEAFWRGKSAAEWKPHLDDADEELRWLAVNAVRHIYAHPEAIPLLQNSLRDESWRVRALVLHHFLDILAAPDRDAELTDAVLFSEVLPDIRRLAEDADPRVREEAVAVLRYL